ncbi:MAG TPA: hypothetical protein H9747_05380 [Candidatus Blautia stercorigallinarum]|uniref:Uncharacterized protein n=1 Tax=Candidatus Blautia stercorigallinarum TaxID=2838501 RepID=A0A9D1PC56_9FIRM|nr:hypothetical protein [Candidatus Blautia stercorigallinarum]
MQNMNCYTNTLAEEQEKMQMRIQEDATKMDIRNQKKLYLAQQKMLLKEAERERKKAQCEVVCVDQNGEVFVETKNLQIAQSRRLVTNFTHPKIIILCRIMNQEENIYLFEFDLNEEIHYAMLCPEKCGSPTYLRKKIAASGGYVMGNTPAKQKEYLAQLITLLISHAKEKIYLPDDRGWYLDENGKLKFFNGRWTWKEAFECTR